MKDRLDILLTRKNLAPTREKAKEMIKWGFVIVNDNKILIPSKKFSEEDEIKILKEIKYVSRAGYKLEEAINKFKINIENKTCLDIGSSTGGFVDLLLQRGAKKVYALEIATKQLHQKIAEDKRVVNMEGTDVRKEFDLPEKVDFCSIDATFVSVEEVLSKIKYKLKKEAEIIALIKPPFEKKFWEGIKSVEKEEDYQIIFKNLKKWAIKNGFFVEGIIPSPIEGKEAKQKEFLAHIIIK